MNSLGRCEACGCLWGLGEDAQALVRLGLHEQQQGPLAQGKGEGAQETPWGGGKGQTLE